MPPVLLHQHFLFSIFQATPVPAEIYHKMRPTFALNANKDVLFLEQITFLLANVTQKAP